jgi:hypothetical protein
MKDIIKSAIQSIEVREDLCLRSACHLTTEYQNYIMGKFDDLIKKVSNKKESDLNHLDAMQRQHIEHMRRNALGEYYEAYVYEALIDYMKNETRRINICAKGPDVRKTEQNEDVRSQNGLFHDERGRLLFKGSGIDLAEFDLIFSSDGSIGFAEIKISSQNFKEFERKMLFKANLLKETFGIVPQCFIISNVDISSKKEVRRLLSKADCTVIKTSSLEAMLSPLSLDKIKTYQRNKANEPFVIGIDQIKRNSNFNYLDTHNTMRKIVLDAIDADSTVNLEAELLKSSELVDKVFISIVDDRQIPLFVKNDMEMNNKRIPASEFIKYFDRLALAISVPGLRLGLYARVRKEWNPKPSPVYLKLSLTRDMRLTFQRNIGLKNAPGLYTFIEDIKETISDEQLIRIMGHFYKFVPLEKKDKQPGRAYITLQKTTS